MRHRFTLLVAVIVASLVAAGSAFGFDCIRVSSSLQGLQQSTKSGNWLLLDFGSPAGVQETFAGVGVELTNAQATCFANAYRASNKPKYVALGIGVAGPNGVLARNNKNESVLTDGKGIDYFEATILPAIFGAAEACGITIPE